MIYTITFNPALDYTVNVGEFKIGEINRTTYESIMPGGKGINVSYVLKNLGYDSTALGFIAGFSGMEIARIISESGLNSDFIAVSGGVSRINVKIKSSVETEINARGPEITEKHMKMLLTKIDNIKKGDTLILAGSVPSSVGENTYSSILEHMNLEHMNGSGVLVVIDAENNLLMNTLKYRPFLVKPNNYELCSIFNVPVSNDKDVIAKYASVLHQLGAKNVLVSMAGDGAVLVTENACVLKCDAPKGDVINSVGAGDSMVAGFIAGWYEKHDYEYAFKMGVSAGSARCFSDKLAELEQVKKIFDTIDMVV